MKGWKTISFNIAAILAIIVAHAGFDIPASMIEPLILAGINFALRFNTTKPVGKANSCPTWPSNYGMVISLLS